MTLQVNTAPVSAPENIQEPPPIRRDSARLLSRENLQSSGVSPTAPTYQCVIVKGPSGIDDLTISEANMPELKEFEVRIAVRAFALNFGDLLCVKGLYPTMPPYPFVPGFEASGVVLDVGQAVTAFKIGDPVIALASATLGGHASAMTCPEELVFHKPVALSFEEACALPVVAITMIAAFDKACLKRGEKILIQTATGGTGLIAIQLANHYGAEIYATAGSQPKLDYLKQLGVPYRINYQETDFEKEIERLTEGQGVDVVINTLSGNAIQKGMNCLSPGGRYIEIAMTALRSARTIDLSVFSRNQALYSVDLRELAQTNPATFKQYCHKMLQLVKEGIITPTVSRVFAWERLKEAYEYLENRQNIGKIVVRIPEAQSLRTTPLWSPAGAAGTPPCSGRPQGRRSEGLPTLENQPPIPLTQHEPIAIIGMSGRFARSETVGELWEHLTNGTDLIEEVSRWDHVTLSPDSVEQKKAYCKHGSFLTGIDRFDPLFFNISGLEATYMDPQQRLVLEESWKALEDAGYAGMSMEGQMCGVYMGCAAGDYQHLFDDVPPAQAFWGNAGSVIPARIAYYLNLQGPAIAIDTACSSSLVAMHLACQGLWSREIDMALAGGVFIQCTPQFYQSANRAEMLSLTGRCATFDDRADGFVPGEGVGIVVLKRLKDALASGDHIYAVIRGSGVNQDGTTRGITVPSANSQERLLRSVYETFQIHPAQIQMVEAHGTGTKLGDPIEYEALTRTFHKYTDKEEYCAIGSIKSNLGHAVTAAGVAGLIKILLSLQHNQIPPSLHFESENTHIQFKGSPFYVNTRLKDWTVAPGLVPGEEDGRRCAAISSFGFSGTNAHMVIEEAPYVSRRYAEKPGYLIVLSARTSDQLRQQVEQLATFCACNAELDCGNISYTLLLGRKHLKHRLVSVVRSHKELGALLSKWLEKGKVPQVSVSNLENREQEENASLKHYGNQCIQDCAETGLTPVRALTPEIYLERLSVVADLYLQGYALAFEQLFAGQEYARISLPTYPFARERYWVPTTTRSTTTHKAVGTVQGSCPPPTTSSLAPGEPRTQPATLVTLHPLVQRNTSTLEKQQFSSTFRGDEFFLTDHEVLGQHVMPAVAYLEMARAAVAIASGLIPQVGADALHDSSHLRLSHVAWVRPLICDSAHPITVHITLSPQESGTIAFVISRDSVGTAESSYAGLAPHEGEGTEQILVCQGTVVPQAQSAVGLSASQSLDLTAVLARCQHQISASECYQRYRELSISYGPTLQGLEQLHVGNGEVLARIHLPVAPGIQTHTDFVLHPSILDASLQACIGLLIDPNAHQNPQLRSSTTVVPFELDELSIIGEVPTQGWAWVRQSSHKAGQIFDIEVCDEAGRIAVHLHGLSVRPLITEGQTAHRTPNQKKEEQQAVVTIEQESLRERARTYFKKQLAALVQFSVQQIEASTPLENYGIDSLMAIHFTEALEDSFGPLSKTLLFEYPTVNSVTEHFLHSYPEQLKAVLGIQEASAATTMPQVTQGGDDTRPLFTQAPYSPSSDLRRLSPLQEGTVRTGLAPIGDIAIIGVAGRYPQARDLKEFWENLRTSKDCITEIPPERWDYRLYFDADKNKSGTTYSKWGGFLEGVDEFDPLFFNISPREAEMMDPQERLFLECAFAALEDAGYTREGLSIYQGNGLAGNVGVFVGVMYEEYQLFGAQAQIQGRPVALSGHPSSIANRVSYFCNFHGPSIAVDTMCSSSLTAIHLACQSIQHGSCELAIAGGVNVSIHPNKYLFLGQGKVISSQGNCQSFGQGADGYVPGEGVGAILLKPLAQAEADGDHIYGVIKATAINHGGKTNGYTVPNPHAQAAVIEQALKEARIDPRTISYIEAHGTGTVLGDPIEIAGLTRAFEASGTNPQTRDKQYCSIGSVKSNIGHAESAAGIAGVTKVLLQMHYGQLVPSLHTEVLNPHIDFSATPFVVQQELAEWKRPQVSWAGERKGREEACPLPRRAGVSSFGAGGSNAHVILEEYVESPQRSYRLGTGQTSVPNSTNPNEDINGWGSRLASSLRPALIVLSARTQEQLHKRVQQLLVWIRNNSPWSEKTPSRSDTSEDVLDNLAYTLQVGREAMEERLALQVSSLQELEEKLRRFLQGQQRAVDWYRGHVKQYDPMRSFATDEDGQKLVVAWMSKGKYEQLLEWWVRGIAVNWMYLYTIEARSAQDTTAEACRVGTSKRPTATTLVLPRRIGLPTYPFARERYWIPAEASPIVTVSTRSLTATTIPPFTALHPQDTGATTPMEQSIPLVDTLEEGRRDGADPHLLLCIPLWDLVILPKPATASGLVPENPTNKVVIVGGTADEQNTLVHIYPHAHTLEIPTGTSIERLAQHLQEDVIRSYGSTVDCSTTDGFAPHVFWFAPHNPQLTLTQESILSAQQQGVLACFRLIKALLQLGCGRQMLRWTVITRQARTLHANETADPTHASLLGLFGSLAKETSRWNIQQADLPADAPLPLEEILRLPADPQGHGWLYRNGHWYRQTLIPLDISSLKTGEAYRTGGVYVVIGGAGGIGEVWSEYLINRYQAQIVWIGRRKIDAEILAKQQRLVALGPRPQYIRADATDLRALQQAYQEIKRNFGRIHGVVDSAIVLLDQSLANMDEERFLAALSAKVEVSVRLAQVFEHEPLDFVLFFSSLSAFVRPAGQSNYAAGCTFENAFATQLSRNWSCAVKVMNWGYWGSVGVVASPQYRDRMAQVGLGSIQPKEAMEALEYLLAMDSVDQMVFLKTTKPAPPGRSIVQDTGSTQGAIPTGDAWSEMIRTEETMTVYPEHRPSSIPNLYNYGPLDHSRAIELATGRGMLEMEELLYQLLWSQLQMLGLFREKQVVLADLRERAGISTTYKHWLQESITLLEHQQYLTLAPDGHATCTVLDPTLIDSETLWQRWRQHKEQWMQNADLKAQVMLVETMVRALPAILTGKRPATEVMFAGGSLQLVEGIYQHHAIADSSNDILARLLVSYLQDQLTYDKHTQIRVLEIGAGTGGTTSRVLQMLQPYQASMSEYCYSDISEAFLRHGQRCYATDYPYLTYRLFNVEKPLAGQRIEPGSYDLVIATNVLHATSNIRHAVRNAKAALKKHGLLLLNEITGTNLFSHLTFGLLSGWWAYEDPELRVPGCPALSAEIWQAVLSSEGFGKISFPVQEMQPTGASHSLSGQQVIVAESDGMVRQPPMRGGSLSKGGLLTDGTVIPTADNTDEVLREKSIAYLKGLVAKALNLASTKIDAAEPLSNYGLDSILVLQLTEALRADIEGIDSTLFFEYNTIEELVEHFLHTQKGALERLFGVTVPAKQEDTHTLDHEPLAQSLVGGSLQGSAGTLRRFLTEEQTGSRRDAGEATREMEPVPISLGVPVAPSRERDIAIIGLAGRYPQAKNVQTFWHLLKAGKSAISEIPPQRWDWRRFFQAERGGTPSEEPCAQAMMYTKWGGFLEDVECFDASFFHISPREAQQMDPQERLFLEVSYACIEDAGYTPTGLQEHGSVGVFAGVMNGNYSTGAKYWSIANRVSFALGLRGPSVAVDTACSSSLTALHFAVESLLSGTSTCAIVGGVNLIVDPVHYVRLSQFGMLSASNQCKSFGEEADGFVDGEGVGVLLLKPLRRAEADGDQIYGVIKATAINHGGKTNGYTVPNPQAQAEVIEQALQRAGIDPRTISYVEAHGTGTELGDPIEIAGLARAFENGMQDKGTTGRSEEPHTPVVQDTQATGWCAIGSVKSNIGHIESAAGIAGITKVLLQMRHGQLVPSLHAEVLNPHIDFSATPFVVQQELAEWKRLQVLGAGAGPLPRRAGVSSFGAGGSNAHVILEEYVAKPETHSYQARPDRAINRGSSRPALILLSARTEEQLYERAQQLLAWIKQEVYTEEDLDNLAYTLQVGREAMEERLALLANSCSKLQEKLHKYVSDSTDEGGDWYRGQMKRNDALSIFAADEEGQKAITTWMSKGQYEKLLSLWVKGLTIDWKHLYGEYRPRRISLPTYPFARERYWIPTPKVEPTASPTPAVTSSSPISGAPEEISPQGTGSKGDWDLENSLSSLASPKATREKERDYLRPTDPNRVTLRPLADRIVPSRNRTDQPQPSVGQSMSAQSFDTNEAIMGADLPVAYGATDLTVGVGLEPHPIPATPALEEDLARSLAQTLYMEQSAIDVEKPFVEMGLDSVVAVEWIKSINKQYAINLTATKIYDHPTIRELASVLQKELAQYQHPPVGTGLAPVRPAPANTGAIGSQQTEASPTLTSQQHLVPGTPPHRRVDEGLAPSRPLRSPAYQRVIIERPGGIDDLTIAEAPLPELQDKEVHIAVHAFSLNFGDLLCAKGLYPTMPPYPFTPGFEASGVVLDVGRAVTAFKVGDPVMALAGATLGGHANAMTCPEELVFHKPAILSFEEACALPVVTLTMIAAFDKARLKRGEKILIQTATGGTGLIAIQLANYYGAEIYATAGSQPKLDYLKQLGVPYRINYQETDFAKEIERLTEGQGVDVVINTLSGDAIQKGMNCLAAGGRYVEIAMTALKSARTIDLSVLSRNQTFYSVDLRELAFKDPTALKPYYDEMLQLVEAGVITPTVCQVFDWQRLKDAYHYLENRQNIGKIVVRIPQADQVSPTAYEQRIRARHSSSVNHGAPDHTLSVTDHELTPTLERKGGIAIVGMSGKYADASNLSTFWENLVQGRNSVREIPLSRWNAADYYDPNPSQEGKIYCKWLGALDEIEYFDPLFFHLSPAEAEVMDPQHRLFLEEGFKAFEDAGYSPELLSNMKCGVYLGMTGHEYDLLLSRQNATEVNLFGGSPAIAAARLAYLLNLKGPAIPIDTACSSSLVATHLACQALSNQEIDMALIGGVSLCLTPSTFAGLCATGMLSPSGQCKTCDASADGFVPGEGAGALVLKRLADAETDHDQIYGVIIASGMNQDGATNGITAPSVKSQIDLEREIYGKSQINPESISYVELHGTGTKLGDPIELEALATVFEEKTQRKNFCAIGSVKTNIGHTLAAAGMVGLQKVLLSMQQKKLVPSLHFEQPNEHFDFAASPFYVNTRVQDWQSVKGTPRRAAVSAFSFSGTNVHLVVEEYIPARRDRARPRPETPSLFVLSAKSESQLKSYAQKMQRWIQTHPELALEDIAFTLQLGRKAMNYRLAIEAPSHEILLQRLERFIDKQTSTGVYTAQVRQSQWTGSTGSDAAFFTADEDAQSLLHIWFQKKKLANIAQAWVRGMSVDWNLLYTIGTGSCLPPTSPTMPHRISLPTYPFARKRYWIPTEGTGLVPASAESLAATTVPTSYTLPLHPLVHHNISTSWKQQFSSTFSGDEFFLADHVVKGQRIMPGVAYLEMARAAIACGRGRVGSGLALDSTLQAPQVQADVSHEPSNLRLSHIMWVRPLVVSSHPVKVHISLSPQENGAVSFLINREEQEGETKTRTLLSQGTAEWHAQSDIPSLNLPALQARCQSQISATRCYQRYRELGISYGPTFQGLEQLHVGDSEVLAHFHLPVAPKLATGVQQTHTDFVLHPSILDTALQACIGLVIERANVQGPHLPFALKELSILGKVPTQGWVWVRQRSDNATGLVFDIEVCDDAGCVALRLHGLSMRTLQSTAVQRTGRDARASKPTVQRTPLGSALVADGRIIRLSPLWDQIFLSQQTSVPESLNQVVIIGGTPDEQSAIVHIYPHAHTLEIPVDASIENLAQLLSINLRASPVPTDLDLSPVPTVPHVFWLAPHNPPLTLTQESILSAQPQGVLACFRLIKAFLQIGYACETLHWTVITRQARTLHAAETVDPTHASLLGLFGSLAKEHFCWKIQLVDLAFGAPLPLAEMQRLPADPQGHGWLYRNGSWYRQSLIPLDVSSFAKREVYRRSGVYVVIGGAGGIGEVWSEYLICRYQAQMVWIGRRQIDAEIQAKQERLATLGPRPSYITADATDSFALQRAYQEIKQHFGQIHGVVHSAIVFLDQSLANMDEEHFQAALAAKVEVSVCLAQVFEQEPLDFVLFFSSFNTFIRPPGQSNYAAGCTFEDAFAARLGQDWSCSVKVINWGYWGSVGVVASPEYRTRMARVGMASIEPAEAMEALEDLLAAPVNQMALLKTTKPVTTEFPLVGEIVQAEEILIGLGPECLPSCIHNLENANPHQYVEKELTNAETRQSMQEIGKLLSRLLWSHLQSLGLFKKKHAALTNLREQAGISASYDRWLQESVAFLESWQYLHCHGTTCTVVDPKLVESTTLWQCWDEHKERWMQNADLKAQVVLVEATLRVLPAILTGKRSATEILFPNGSLELVEGIYQHHVIADYFNEVLARVLVTYLQERLTSDRGARIRILEIGAGTGGTTSRVLQMLQPYQASIAEYCYSDISEVFLLHGQQMYGEEYPYLSYQILNVEKPLAGQGIEPGSYDLVIAANVLHATSNIRHTVRNAKAALKKHGLLLLNEITGSESHASTASLFTHLTFGLLSGWWAYEDSVLRVPGCPALTAENWQMVLSSEGFGAIYIPTQEAGQQIIVAESDGITRQQYVQPASRAPRRQTLSTEHSQQRLQDRSEAHVAVRVTSSLTVPDSGVGPDTLLEALKHMVSRILRVEIEEIDAETELSEYGFDSISFTAFASLLNQTYQLDLSPPLFFEHSTLERLNHYLHANYAHILAPHFAAGVPPEVTQQAASGVKTDEAPPTSDLSRQRVNFVREAAPGNRVLFLKVSSTREPK